MYFCVQFLNVTLDNFLGTYKMGLVIIETNISMFMFWPFLDFYVRMATKWVNVKMWQDLLGAGYTRSNTRWHNIDSYSMYGGQQKVMHPLNLQTLGQYHAYILLHMCIVSAHSEVVSRGEIKDTSTLSDPGRPNNWRYYNWWRDKSHLYLKRVQKYIFSLDKGDPPWKKRLFRKKM